MCVCVWKREIKGKSIWLSTNVVKHLHLSNLGEGYSGILCAILTSFLYIWNYAKFIKGIKTATWRMKGFAHWSLNNSLREICLR